MWVLTLDFPEESKWSVPSAAQRWMVMGMGKRDLITKDFALYVVHYFNSMQTWSKEDILGEIDRTIKDAKAEDAVPVVRCKDCKYAMDMMPIENSGGYMMGECTLRKEDDIVFTAWGDDFCSYGERKEK